MSVGVPVMSVGVRPRQASSIRVKHQASQRERYLSRLSVSVAVSPSLTANSWQLRAAPAPRRSVRARWCRPGACACSLPSASSSERRLVLILCTQLQSCGWSAGAQGADFVSCTARRRSLSRRRAQAFAHPPSQIASAQVEGDGIETEAITPSPASCSAALEKLVAELKPNGRGVCIRLTHARASDLHACTRHPLQTCTSMPRAREHVHASACAHTYTHTRMHDARSDSS
jgi:hypothetical protein